MDRFHQYLILCLILTITYIYAIIFAVYMTGKNDGWGIVVNDIHESCLLDKEYDFGLSKLSYRGHNYIIAGDPVVNEKIQNCAITFWSGSHFLMYAFIGFFCPDLFFESLIIGIGFELWEYKEMDCHDTLDIIMNSAGFMVGKIINQTMC